MSNPRRPSGDEPRRSKKKKRSRRWLAYTFLIMVGIGLGVAGMVGAFVYKAYRTLPVYADFDPSLTSVIYDSKGREVYKLAAAENRTLVKLDEIPLEIQQALVATEDARFYDHFGVDVIRVMGATWNSVKYVLGRHNQLEGASTITMQLTTNSFLTRDGTLMYKVQQALIAMDLERRFTKKEILEKYFNQVPWGEQAHGIEAAAQTYFAKHAKDLTLSEGALLVGMLKATTFYNPFENLEGALNRRKVVLDQMVKYGYLSKEKAEELKPQKPEVKRAKVSPTAKTFTGDWYVDHVISILTDNPPGTAARYGTPLFAAEDLYAKGLKIYTALDLDMQKVVDDKLQKMMPEATKEYGNFEVPQAAAVVMNHQTGHVKAITGGLKHDRMLGYNRATQAYRQPGSTIKPLVSYLPSIDLLGWGPGTVIDDSPPRLSYPDQKHVWPENYDFTYSGLKPMRHGLEQSINAMAVRALEAVTPKKAIEYARKAGLTTIKDASQGAANDENLALALGGLTVGVTPLDLTSAYGTLGALGMRVDPVVITRIESKYGETIYEATPRKQQVINKDSTWLMVDIMKGSIIRGTAAGEAKGWKGWPAAGKTGTTENWHDAWFVGFTSELVTGVWTGYDNDEKQQPLPSSPNRGKWTGAGPPTRIWTAIMSEIVKERPADWPVPSGVVKAQICKTSGKLPSPLCPKDDIVEEWFRRDAVPKQVDDVWRMEKVVRQPFVDSATGKPVIDSRTKKPVEKYYLWREGCGTAESLLLIKRPTKYVRHPSDPWNFGRYWPTDWWREAPTELCTPTAEVPVITPGDPGTQPPGTQPPGTQPPGTQPPGQQPPGNQPPVQQPPGNQPPGGLLPPILPPITPPGGGGG